MREWDMEFSEVHEMSSVLLGGVIPDAMISEP